MPGPPAGCSADALLRRSGGPYQRTPLQWCDVTETCCALDEGGLRVHLGTCWVTSAADVGSVSCASMSPQAPRALCVPKRLPPHAALTPYARSRRIAGQDRDIPGSPLEIRPCPPNAMCSAISFHCVALTAEGLPANSAPPSPGLSSLEDCSNMRRNPKCTATRSSIAQTNVTSHAKSSSDSAPAPCCSDRANATSFSPDAVASAAHITLRTSSSFLASSASRLSRSSGLNAASSATTR